MNSLLPLKSRIIDIKLETDKVRTYTIEMKSFFSAQPGQFNMLGYPGIGEVPISFSSKINGKTFQHTIRSAGKVTRFLEGFVEGNEIFVRGPYGRGWPIKQAEGKDVLLVAGGIGIAPLRPVIEMILEKRESFGEISLIYGAKNEKSVLFMTEFDKWGEKISVYPTVDEITQKSRIPVFAKKTESSAQGIWKYHVGLVTDLLDRIKIRPDNTVAFVCGPEIMMRFVCRGLVMLRIPESMIYVSMERRMKCGIGHCGHCQHYGLFVCKDGPVFSYKRVKGLPDGFL